MDLFSLQGRLCERCSLLLWDQDDCLSKNLAVIETRENILNENQQVSTQTIRDTSPTCFSFLSIGLKLITTKFPSPKTQSRTQRNKTSCEIQASESEEQLKYHTNIPVLKYSPFNWVKSCCKSSGADEKLSSTVQGSLFRLRGYFNFSHFTPCSFILKTK